MKPDVDSSAKVVSRMIVGLSGIGLLVLMLPILIETPTLESIYATAMVSALLFGYACGVEKKMLGIMKKDS